jgi:hypothetical protein
LIKRIYANPSAKKQFLEALTDEKKRIDLDGKTYAIEIITPKPGS